MQLWQIVEMILTELGIWALEEELFIKSFGLVDRLSAFRLGEGDNCYLDGPWNPFLFEASWK